MSSSLSFGSVVAGALALSGVFLSADASACGGCVHLTESEVGQVTGHRMIFSVSSDKTTLWDQIQYQGAPEGFAWVLPIRGEVEVGLSSDALFESLQEATAIDLEIPDVCSNPQSCPEGFGGAPGGNGGGSPGEGASGPGTVAVIAQETVGPFETVQLSSTDPAALQTWLAEHGYAIPADVASIIDTYVSEGFDFLAMRLAPGENVSAMQPVRVTSPGAGLTLPLRMVAAGTGAITPITLWIVGEGRYEPTNFPLVDVDLKGLVWNWDTRKSNYAELVAAAFANAQNDGWQVEGSISRYKDGLLSYLSIIANSAEPASIGYGATSEEATLALQTDKDALWGGIPGEEVRITRIHAQLSKAALGTDLELGASADQSELRPYHFVSNTVGTPPACPAPDCVERPGGEKPGDSDSGCAVSSSESRAPNKKDIGTGGALLGLLSLAAAWSRRRSARNTPTTR